MEKKKTEAEAENMEAEQGVVDGQECPHHESRAAHHESRSLSEISDAEMVSACRRQDILKETSGTKKMKNKALKRYCKERGLSISTIHRWRQLESAGGLTALARKERVDKGQARTIDMWTTNFIISRYQKKHRPSMAEVHRDVNRVLEIQELKPVSYSTVRRILDEIPKQLSLYERGTKKEIRDNAYHVKRERPDKPRKWADADHHRLDIFVKDAKGRPFRPWLTAIQDMCTNEILGFHISNQANSQTIALALRRAILRKPDSAYPSCGIFDNFLTDWGRDFLSRDVRAFTNDAGINREKANPYKGQEKPIERFFRTLEEQCIRKLPGWCGNKPENRPDYYKPELTLSDLNPTIYNWIVNEFHHFKSAALAERAGHPKRSPLDVLKDAIGKGFAPRVPREDTLDILLLRSRKRKVQKNGISLMGRDGSYWCDELSMHIGDRVDIRYDPDHLGYILVYSFKEGKQGASRPRLIGRAVHMPRLKMDASEADLKEIGRIKKRQHETAKEFHENIKKESIGFDALSEVAHTKMIEKNQEEGRKIEVAQGAPVTQIIPEYDMRHEGPRIFTSEAERDFEKDEERD